MSSIHAASASEHSPSASPPTSSPTEERSIDRDFYERTPVLEDAWQRFGDYDKNAVIAQRRFIRQRKWIAGLGVASTTMAVLYLVIEVTSGQQGPPLSRFFPSLFTGQLSGPVEFIMGMVSFSVVLLPITVTVLIAASIKFNMGGNWVMLRGSAETLKKKSIDIVPRWISTPPTLRKIGRRS